MRVGHRRGSRPLKKGPEILETRARRGHRGDCARIRTRGEIGIRRGSAGFRLGVGFLEGGRSREAAQWVLRGRRSTAQRASGAEAKQSRCDVRGRRKGKHPTCGSRLSVSCGIGRAGRVVRERGAERGRSGPD